MNKVKLTKKAVNEFIRWTTSRYNDYLGYGTKQDAVLTIYHSILRGYLVNVYKYNRGKRNGEIDFRENAEITKFVKECASPVGESGTNKRGSYWSTKQGGDEYTIDCTNKTITAKYSQRVITFI